MQRIRRVAEAYSARQRESAELEDALREARAQDALSVLGAAKETAAKAQAALQRAVRDERQRVESTSVQDPEQSSMIDIVRGLYESAAASNRSDVGDVSGSKLRRFEVLGRLGKCKKPSDVADAAQTILRDVVGLSHASTLSVMEGRVPSDASAIAEIEALPHVDRMAQHVVQRWFEQEGRPGCTVDSSVPLFERLMGMQRLAGVLMWPEFPNRGILLAHPVGSGKTCTFVAVLNTLLEAAQMGKDSGFLTVNIVLPRDELIVDFKREISCTCGSEAMVKAFKAKPDNETSKSSLSLGPLTVNFVPLTRRSEWPRTFEGSVVMCDEAHNIMHPPGGTGTNDIGRSNAFALRLELLRAKKVKVVLATATPLPVHPSDLALLNLIRPRQQDGTILMPFPDEFVSESGEVQGPRGSVRSVTFDIDQRERLIQTRKQLWDTKFKDGPEEDWDGLLPQTKKFIQDASRGLVSYVDAQSLGKGDTYPQLRVSADTLHALSKDAKATEAFESALGANRIQEVPAVDEVIVEVGNTPTAAVAGDYRWNPAKGPKLQAVCERVWALWDRQREGLRVSDAFNAEVQSEHSNKQALYVSDIRSKQAVVQALESSRDGRPFKALFMTEPNGKPDPHSIEAMVKNGKNLDEKLAAIVDRLKQETAASSEPIMRWLVFGDREAKSNTRFVTEKAKMQWQSYMTVAEKLFNHADNTRGQLVHGIIFDDGSKEGKSFLQTTHMHMVDVPGGKDANRGKRNQVMGRITRMFSHCAIPEKFVRFFMYATSLKPGGKFKGAKKGKSDSQALTKEQEALSRSKVNGPADDAATVLTTSAIDAGLYGNVAGARGGSREPKGFCLPVGGDLIDFAMGDASWSVEFEKDFSSLPFPALGRDAVLPDPVRDGDFDAVPSQCRKGNDARGVTPRVFLALPPENWTNDHEAAFAALLLHLMRENLGVARQTGIPLPGSIEGMRREVARVFDADLETVKPVQGGLCFVTHSAGKHDQMASFLQQQLGWGLNGMVKERASQAWKSAKEMADSAAREAVSYAKTKAYESWDSIKDVDWENKRRSFTGALPIKSKLARDGRTTLYVSYHTLLNMHRLGEAPHPGTASVQSDWWKGAVSREGVVQFWLEGLVPQDLSNLDTPIPVWMGNETLVEPETRLPFPIRPVGSVEKSLNAINTRMSASPQWAAAKAMLTGFSSWDVMKEAWAKESMPPLKGWHNALTNSTTTPTADEICHALFAFTIAREASCPAQLKAPMLNAELARLVADEAEKAVN